ncbi:MAG: hypothetical protein H7A25_14980 [Leptospiraceae bacterium]|nr:hypothetical protein [Leptospiraceae bacterium]MCP5501205.1 hypothetical protein [Leptospiraceae bacterium]
MKDRKYDASYDYASSRTFLGRVIADKTGGNANSLLGFVIYKVKIFLAWKGFIRSIEDSSDNAKMIKAHHCRNLGHSLEQDSEIKSRRDILRKTDHYIQTYDE